MGAADGSEEKEEGKTGLIRVYRNTRREDEEIRDKEGDGGKESAIFS